MQSGLYHKAVHEYEYLLRARRLTLNDEDVGYEVLAVIVEHDTRVVALVATLRVLQLQRAVAHQLHATVLLYIDAHVTCCIVFT